MDQNINSNRKAKTKEISTKIKQLELNQCTQNQKIKDTNKKEIDANDSMQPDFTTHPRQQPQKLVIFVKMKF